MSPELSESCAHCGTPAPAGPAPVFCCGGCATVYAALQGCGLDRWYAMRRELGAPAPARGGARLTADLLALDDVERLREHGHAPGDAVLRLDGLHCAACVWLLERLPRAVPGVLAARVDFGAALLHVRWDPTQTKLSEIAAFVDGLGYPPSLASAQGEQAASRGDRAALWRIGVTGALAANAMLSSFALYAGADELVDRSFAHMFEWIGLACALPSVTWGAWPFHAAALAGLRMRVFHMDLPISIGVLAGFAASAWATLTGGGAVYFDSVAMLVFLLLLGRRLQQWGRARVRTQLEVLGALVPATAMRREAQGWTRVRSDALLAGDVVRIDGDQRFPVDGEVVAGRGHADLAVLTGESVPEEIAPGSAVFAGAINVGAPVEIRVAKAGASTRLGALVQRAFADDLRPAPIVRMADRIAGWFVAAVLSLAAIGGVMWWRVDPRQAFDVVVALLVISCPCALGLATPIALAVARSRAAGEGILLRSGAALEVIARARTVVLDKTGTLSEGRQRVTASSLPAELRPLVAAVERRSRHPIARAIAAWAASEHEPVPTELHEHPGLGIEAVVDGRRLRIGSAAWLGAERDEVRAAVERAHTPVLVELEGTVIGVIAVADRLRPEAHELVARLRAIGKHIVIASGDHPRVVAAIAAELGIDEAHGGCSPEQKAELVASLPACVMVGDGVNDALALRRAGAGVAVRGGAEAALAVAEAYLADDDLRTLARLFEGARAARRVVIRNLLFSLAYNVTFASLALAGFITPLVAAIIMPISSLTVIGSSLVARTFSRTQPLRPATEPVATLAPAA